jgi:hypothetical protein
MSGSGRASYERFPAARRTTVCVPVTSALLRGPTGSLRGRAVKGSERYLVVSGRSAAVPVVFMINRIKE